METMIICLAICLIVLSLVAIFAIRHLSRKLKEARVYAQDLAFQEQGIKRRHADLERKAAELEKKEKEYNKWIAKRRHVYANVEVTDANASKTNDKAIGKNLSSRIGYAIRKQLPSIKVTHDDKNGGRTVYSVDFYVTEFEG